MSRVEVKGDCIRVIMTPEEVNEKVLHKMSLIMRTNDGMMVVLTCDGGLDDAFELEPEECPGGVCPLVPQLR